MDHEQTQNLGATKPREFISLVLKDESLVGTNRIPFAFFVCSPEEVFECHMVKAASELGLPEETQTEMDEALEVIVAHLCADDRPHALDSAIVRGLTQGFGDIKVARVDSYEMTDSDVRDLCMREGWRLSTQFLQIWKDQCIDLSALVEEPPFSTETHEKRDFATVG
jgi:hypothetical protein